jgi:hypothetical protein
MRDERNWSASSEQESRGEGQDQAVGSDVAILAEGSRFKRRSSRYQLCVANG